jgi:hypothetical protein
MDQPAIYSETVREGIGGACERVGDAAIRRFGDCERTGWLETSEADLQRELTLGTPSFSPYQRHRQPPITNH